MTPAEKFGFKVGDYGVVTERRYKGKIFILFEDDGSNNPFWLEYPGEDEYLHKRAEHVDSVKKLTKQETKKYQLLRLIGAET